MLATHIAGDTRFVLWGLVDGRSTLIGFGVGGGRPLARARRCGVGVVLALRKIILCKAWGMEGACCTGMSVLAWG
jgi:hypothetical protein